MRNTLWAIALSALSAPLAAQEPSDPVPPPKQAAAGAEAAKPEPAKPEAVPGAEAAKPEGAEAAEVKVLAPSDVPAEMLRIEKRKAKADIKCELTMTPTHGREVTVKGVVRNGKLIERFQGREFVMDPTIEHPQCGVRLWWVDNTSGWIFLRYSQIRTISLTGILTAEERQKIMEALRVKDQKREEEKKAQEAEKLEEELLKMSALDLEAYVLREYPQDQGWTHERLRDLKKKQLIDNQPLTRQESIFVSYFPVLIKARLKELKREKDKVEFEPGSADKPADPAGTPSGPVGGQPEKPRGAKPGGTGGTPPVGGDADDGSADDEPAAEDE
jgi:hypothetical protein